MQVGNSDTLEKIALHFNSTPSELLQLNKLNTRIVFPGQVCFISFSIFILDLFSQVLFVPDISSSDITTEQTPPPLISPSPLTKTKDGETFILHTDHRLSSESSPPSTQQDVWSMGRQSTAKPGRAQRLHSQASTESESSSSRTIEDRLKTHKEDNNKQVTQIQETLSMEENHQLDEECLQRFIKVNVRLMTDDHVS